MQRLTRHRLLTFLLALAAPLAMGAGRQVIDMTGEIHFFAGDTAQTVRGFGSHAPSYHPRYGEVTPYYQDVGLTWARFRYVAHPDDSPDFDNTAVSFMGALKDAGITPILIIWYIDRHARMLADRYGALLAEHHPQGRRLLDPDGEWPAYRADFYGDRGDGPQFSSLRVGGQPYSIADLYQRLNWQILRAEDDAVDTLVELMTAAILSYTTHGIELPYVLCFGEPDHGGILHVPPGELYNRCVERLRRRLDGLADAGVGAVDSEEGKAPFTLRDVKIIGPGTIWTFRGADYLRGFTAETVAALGGFATNAYDTGYQWVWDPDNPPFYHRAEPRIDAPPHEWRILLGGGPGEIEGRPWQRGSWSEAVRDALALATPEHREEMEIIAPEFGNTRHRYRGTLYYPVNPEGLAERVLAGEWAQWLGRTYTAEELQGAGALQLYQTLADETTSDTVIHAVHLFEDTLALLNHGFTAVCFWQIHNPFRNAAWALVGPGERKRPHYRALKTLCRNIPVGSQVIRLPADRATPNVWRDDLYAAALIHREERTVVVAMSNITERPLTARVRLSGVRDHEGSPAAGFRVVRSEAFREDPRARDSAGWLPCWDRWQDADHHGKMNPGRIDEVSGEVARSLRAGDGGGCRFAAGLPPVSTLVVVLSYHLTPREGEER